MAEIDIAPLTDRLNDEEIAELAAQLEKAGAPQLPRGDETAPAHVAEGLDETALSEFMDRLEGHDAAADIYLPVEFDDVFEVAELRIGSLPLLLEVLDELKDELDEEEEESEEDEDNYDDDQKILSEQLRQAWKMFFNGATAALERHLPLHIKS